MAFAHVDLWARAPGFVLINLAVGVGGTLLSVLFRRMAQPGNRLGDWFERFLRTDSIERSRASLAEIDRFARE